MPPARSRKFLRNEHRPGAGKHKGQPWTRSCLRWGLTLGGTHMLSGLITIAGGVLAASALIIARKPNAKELIDKITPYQGWIGIVMFVWGVWAVFDCVRHLSFLTSSPLFWTFWLVQGAADLLVGFLLGFGLITK